MKRLLSALMALLLICAPVFGALAEEEVIESAMVEEAVPETEAALPAEEAEAEPHAVSAATADDIPLDAAHFPDKAFRKDLARFDTNGDGALSPKEIKAVKEYQTYGSIKSFTGIGYLSYLTKLSISFLNMKTLDVSGNTRLTELNIWGGKFKTLDLSANTKLKDVRIHGNEQLKTLIFGMNNKLTYLDCHDNALTKLQIGGLSKLERLDCWSNKLAKLDVSGLKNLKGLDCKDNKLTKLDVSKNAKLENLNCWNNKLNKLDVSMLKKLKTLGCGGNSIKKLDLSKNSKLEELFCANNQMTSLKLPGKALFFLSCEGNSIASIDLAKCPLLIRQMGMFPHSYTYDGHEEVAWGTNNDADAEFGKICLRIDKTTCLMNGKKVLYTDKLPKTIRFAKNSITVKQYDLFRLPEIITEPEGAAILESDVTMDDSVTWDLESYDDTIRGIGTSYRALKEGTFTVKIKTKNGKTAKLKIVVK